MVDSNNFSNSEKRRFSLAKAISGAFIGIVVLFLALIILVSVRLESFRTLLSHITEATFPEMTYSVHIHDEVNRLLYFSSQLARARNEAELNIAHNYNKEQISIIEKQISSKESNSYLITQFDVIKDELTNLNRLVSENFLIQKNIATSQNTLYTLQETVFKLSQQIRNQQVSATAATEWALTYSEVISLTSKGLIKRRLQEVRQTFYLIESKLQQVNSKTERLPSESQNAARALTYHLEQLLFSDTGLLTSKIKLLRTSGRVTGKGNFVKNLIDDFLRVVEFRSYQITNEVVHSTHSVLERAIRDSKILGLLTITVLFSLVGVIIFINKRFVKRMVTLNQGVITRLQGGQSELKIKGNDEISDMANAFHYFADKIDEQKKALQSLSLTDSLTGLANRRALDIRLEAELSNAARNRTPVAVLLMDIDYFKKFNDTYGHLAGDHCLQNVGSALARCLKRSTDFAGRYGGEEFVFLLPNTDLKGAQTVAKKIHRQVSALSIPHQQSDTSPHVTLSIGIAIHNGEGSLSKEQLLRNADEAMYNSKVNGRNQTQFYVALNEQIAPNA